MMQRCCSGSLVAGTCSCGGHDLPYYYNYDTCNSFADSSMVYYNNSSNINSMPINYQHMMTMAKTFDEDDDDDADDHMSVDCTLSLGTPSTRLNINNSTDHHHPQEDNSKHRRRLVSSSTSNCYNYNKKSSSSSTSFWGLFQTKNPITSASAAAASASISTTKSSNNKSYNNGSNDPLLARRCANCDTTSTPLWRNGPRGPKSLCNACGIRFKKEERRANANANASSGAAAIMDQSTWGAQYPKKMQMQCFSNSTSNGNGNGFRFIEDAASGDRDFLSWRLNVTDRPSGLIHDFTR